jgi:Family of unknown function (DUF6261)
MDIGKINTENKIHAAFKCYNFVNSKLANDQLALGLAKIMNDKAELVKESLEPKNEKVLTSDLTEVDDKRDDVYRAIYHIIKAHFSYNIHPEHKNIIRNLNNEVCESGLKFISGSYKGESTILNTKINILNKPEFEGVVNTIGLKKYVDELVKVQAEFDAIYDKRKDKKENRPLAIHKTMPALNRAIVTLDSYMEANHDETTYNNCFEPFVSSMKNNTEDK